MKLIFINRATLCVVPFTKVALNQTGSAALKVMEYLAGGANVLATRHSDHSFIEEFKLGALCEPDNPENMAEMIHKLLDDNLNTKCDKQYRRDFVLKNGTWDNTYKTMKDLCKQTIAQK